MADEVERRLHDRATRGEDLSPEEQECLDAWYQAQDQAEAEQLGVDVEPTPESLEARIDATLRQISEATERIRNVAAENKGLRREIAALRLELAQRYSPQGV